VLNSGMVLADVLNSYLKTGLYWPQLWFCKNFEISS